MPAGGARPGAGRKSRASIGQGLLDRAQAQVHAEGVSGDLQDLLTQGSEALQRIILANQERIVLAMLDLACGVYIEDTEITDTEAGPLEQKRVYQQPPDRQAIQWLMEMSHGKPTQKSVVVQDTVINVVHSIKRPALQDFGDTGDVIDVPALVSGE